MTKTVSQNEHLVAKLRCVLERFFEKMIYSKKTYLHDICV